MFLPESEALPDLWTATLDEVLAIRVVVDHELDHPIVCDVSTVSLDETSNRRLDLTQLLAAAIHRPAGGKGGGNARHRIALPLGARVPIPL